MPTLDKVSLDITVVLGNTAMPIHQVLRLGRGAIIELDASENDEVQILANNLPVAKGAVVVQGNRIAVEVRQHRLQRLHLRQRLAHAAFAGVVRQDDQVGLALALGRLALQHRVDADAGAGQQLLPIAVGSVEPLLDFRASMRANAASTLCVAVNAPLATDIAISIALMVVGLIVAVAASLYFGYRGFVSVYRVIRRGQPDGIPPESQPSRPAGRAGRAAGRRGTPAGRRPTDRAGRPSPSIPARRSAPSSRATARRASRVTTTSRTN